MSKDNMISFRCKLPFDNEITKIRKYLDDADIIKIAIGKAGICFYSTTQGDMCYYMVSIHECDMYQLYVNTEKWVRGGIIRSLSAVPFISFLDNKQTGDLSIEVNDDGTELYMSIISGYNTVIKSTTIKLILHELDYEVPEMINANVIIPVNEFKKLCSDLVKDNSDITIYSQKNAIRLVSNTTDTTFGIMNQNEPIDVSIVKNIAFSKATKINIGNTKKSLSGLYCYPDLPFKIKVKLNILNFQIFAKKWIK